MEVILIKDVEKIGKAGTVVKVKEGFARNFLFPHNLAKVATVGSLEQLEKEKKARLAQYALAKEKSEELKKRLAGLSLTISALAQGEELYGSISSHDIAAALKDEGFLIDKNAIELAEPIKSLGIYELPIKLHPEVIATVKLWVVKK
ncbi:MAG: 50S ribosomal protein L9 [Candidatus Omnitrophica bacterium]|jgi:large subunit ribosomal protein L9|nr:50S ribosomal protein L9 [Candidatus Omnitrophota bacterium]